MVGMDTHHGARLFFQRRWKPATVRNCLFLVFGALSPNADEATENILHDICNGVAWNTVEQKNSSRID